MLKKYGISVWNVVCSVIVGVSLLVCNVGAFAATSESGGLEGGGVEGGGVEEGFSPAEVFVDNLVDTYGLQMSLLIGLSKWLGIGMTIGVSVYVVFAGWRFLRRFVSGDTANQNSI